MNKMAALRKLALMTREDYLKMPGWREGTGGSLITPEGETVYWSPGPAQTNQAKPEPRGGGVVAEPPLEVAEPPTEPPVRIDPRMRRPKSATQKPAKPKMTREEWLRMGQEMGWGGTSTNSPAKPSQYSPLYPDTTFRDLLRRSRRGGSNSPRISSPRAPRWEDWGSPRSPRWGEHSILPGKLPRREHSHPEIGWKDGDPVPEGYEVIELPTYPPKRFIAPKPIAL